MHILGANLHFEHLAGGPQHRGMNGAVAVVLGIGDVVIELAGNVRPRRMHHAEGRVALRHALHHHPQRLRVIDLAEVDALAPHLEPDAVDVLGAPDHLGLDAGLLQAAAQLRHRLLHLPFPLLAAGVEGGRDLAVILRAPIAEREILQGPLQLADAQAPGQRSEHPQRLVRHPLLRFARGRLGGAQGHHALRQLDDRDAGIVDERRQQVADVLHLAAARVGEQRRVGKLVGVRSAHAQQRFEERRHVLVDTVPHHRRGHGTGVGRFVEEPGGSDVRVHFQLAQQMRDVQPVAQVRGVFDQIDGEREHAAALPHFAEPRLDIRAPVRRAWQIVSDSHHQAGPALIAPRREKSSRDCSGRSPTWARRALRRMTLAARRTSHSR